MVIFQHCRITHEHHHVVTNSMLVSEVEINTSGLFITNKDCSKTQQLKTNLCIPDMEYQTYRDLLMAATVFWYVTPCNVILYRVIKKSLCTWLLQYRKLQVMFKVSPVSLQTFIDTPNCALEDRVQYSTVHIPNVLCDGHIFECFCTVIIRCTETFWSPCSARLSVGEDLPPITAADVNGDR
jgi:hypothetical protein